MILYRELSTYIFVYFYFFFHFFSCLVGGASPLKRKVLFWFFVSVVTLYFLFTLGLCPGSVKFCQPRLFSPGRVIVSCEFVFSLKFFNGIFSKRIFVFHGNVSTECFPKEFLFFMESPRGSFSKGIFVFQLESPRGSFSKGNFCFSIGKSKGIFLKRDFFCFSFLFTLGLCPGRVWFFISFHPRILPREGLVFHFFSP